jgi:hypothetical protein
VCIRPKASLTVMFLTYPEILTMRQGMWEKIVRRKHTAIKVFPFGPNSDEVMLYGTVEYGLKDGREAKVDWSARAHLIKEDGAVMMDFYQVYLVSRSHSFGTGLCYV